MIFLFLVVMFAAAADAPVPTFFVKTMPIAKIYTYSLGFEVVYIKSDLSIGRFYVPIGWFDQAGGKGVLIKGSDPSYPYFSIFWKNGKFDYIKLYVKSDLKDPSWGTLTPSTGLAAEFNIETLKVNF